MQTSLLFSFKCSLVSVRLWFTQQKKWCRYQKKGHLQPRCHSKGQATEQIISILSKTQGKHKSKIPFTSAILSSHRHCHHVKHYEKVLNTIYFNYQIRMIPWNAGTQWKTIVLRKSSQWFTYEINQLQIIQTAFFCTGIMFVSNSKKSSKKHSTIH